MIYYNKYIKYKTKYNNLKIQIGGLYTIDILEKQPDKLKPKEIKELFIKNIKENGILVKPDCYLFSFKIYDNIYNCLLYITELYDEILILFLIKDYPLDNLSNIDIARSSFIQLHLDETEEISTERKFDTFIGKTKLETIMEIIKLIYIFFKKDDITLYDVATFKCPDSDKYKYNAIFYRIFKTKKPFNDLSIYAKFGYKYSCDDDKTAMLENIRNTSIDELISSYDIIFLRVEASRKAYNISILDRLKKERSLIKGDISIANFFDRLRMDINPDCTNNIDYFKFLTSGYNIYLDDKNRNYPKISLMDNLIELVTCVDELKYEL